MAAPLVQNRRFLMLWIGQGASFAGDAISMVALVVLVTQITGSASAVGGALIARLLPTLASPFFGVLADRIDRRTILVASDVVRALLALGMVFARDLFLLYGLVFLMGTAQALFNPTVRAAFPSVVGRGDLTRANALIGGTFSVAVTVGPAVGGLLVGTAGVEVAFLVDAATFLISGVLLSRIPLPRPSRESQEEGFTKELRAGLVYLVGARVPLALVAGAFVTVLATDLATPAEIFLAKGTFGAGDAGYGLLLTVWGAGMVIGSAATGLLADRGPLFLVYFLSIFAWALALVGVGLSPTFLLALILLMVAGAANGVDNVVGDTILQQRVPDALLGRVFSVRFMGFGLAEALAYAAGGLLVDATGPRPAYLLAGAATAAAGLLVLALVVLIPSGRDDAAAREGPADPER